MFFARQLSKALLGGLLLATGAIQAAHAVEPDELLQSQLKGMKHSGGALRPDTSRFGPALQGFDSVVNFTGQFTSTGFDLNGNPASTWSWSMVGNSPAAGGTTRIRAPIIPVTVELLDANGAPRFVNGKRLRSSSYRYIEPVVESPLFQDAHYATSDEDTQYNDAIMRAQFFNDMRRDWHTILQPRVMQPRTLSLLQGQYHFALNTDGSCCYYILADATAFGNALFPATVTDTTTPIGAAEHAGDMTTKDITTLVFPNVFLYDGTLSNCCIIGYHSFDYEPGDASNGNLPRFYVMNYSSWVSADVGTNVFGDPTFQGVVPMSHELAETFADPFVGFDNVHNLTPFWLAPNGQCGNILEVGDVIEGLPNAQTTVTVDGTPYYVQNEALLSWFNYKPTHDAYRHAYSFPDTTVLPSNTTPQNFNCQ